MYDKENITREIVRGGRRIRHYLTESAQQKVPRKNKVFQFLLGSKKQEVQVRSQQEADKAFADLERLVAIAVPFWLRYTDQRAVGDEIFDFTSYLKQVYPKGERTSYMSRIQDSVFEIMWTLNNIQSLGVGAVDRWFRINTVDTQFRAMGQDTVFVAPLTTDYFVARLFNQILFEQKSTKITVAPVGWMPGMDTVALSSETHDLLRQDDVKTVHVMVDRYIKGITGLGIQTALNNMFLGKEITATRN